MDDDILKWPAEAIWQEVYPLLPGFTVEILPEIDSSNSELMRRIRDGRTEPTLLVAEQQTAGRGRMGRDWRAVRGDALTFSLALPLAPRDWSGLSLVAGVAIAESLHPELGLKWPNDLWWQDRKVGGILVETAGPGGAGAARSVVVGVGLNIVAPPAGDGLRTPPAGLRELAPGITAPQALGAVVPALARALLEFASHGFAPWQARFAERDVLRGRPVQLSDGRRGTAASVDADGVLRLQTEDGGWESVRSAEVGIRPAT